MIDWSKPVCTKHETPHIGRLLEDCDFSGRKRVSIYSPSMLIMKGGAVHNTTFRYDADGKTRGDRKPSENDLTNFDPHDGAVRIDLDGRKIVCAPAKAA